MLLALQRLQPCTLIRADKLFATLDLGLTLTPTNSLTETAGRTLLGRPLPLVEHRTADLLRTCLEAERARREVGAAGSGAEDVGRNGWSAGDFGSGGCGGFGEGGDGEGAEGAGRAVPVGGGGGV